MPSAKHNNRTARLLIFAALALPLGYFFVAGAQGVSLLSLLGLSVLYLTLRPFTVSAKTATVLLVLYLAVSGLVSFSQPLFSESWPAFASVMLLSALMQPVIFVLALDSVLAILGRNHRMYDMVVVVLLWLSTLAVTFGSTALLQGGSNDAAAIIFLFVVPWLVNGVVFMAASLVLAFISGQTEPKKYTKKRIKKKK